MAIFQSTGDIRENYETLLVMTTMIPDVPFTYDDYQSAWQKGLNLLAGQAQQIGGNGLIWIQSSVFQSGNNLVLTLSGTAVKVQT